MTDTMTVYTGGKETVVVIDAQPDPSDPGHVIINNPVCDPLRCKLSLRDHAYNIVLSPDSYVIIDADEAELFRNSRSDDRVIFTLPSSNPTEFYVEQYMTGTKGQTPYTAVVMRHHESHKMLSAALYPRDLESLPDPLFLTSDRKTVKAFVKETSATVDPANPKATYTHSPRDVEFILKAVFHPDDKSAIDPNAPKLDWF